MPIRMTAFYIASFPEPFVFEAGLPAASALAFKETLGLTNAELAALLGVSVRTLARWDPSRSRLDLVSGDRLVHSVRLFGIAAEVLEDAEAAAR